MKTRFFWFLKENNALAKFMFNIYAQRTITMSAAGVLSIVNNPKNWLMGTFTWYITPEGHKYWEQLDERWYVIAHNMEIANN